MAQREIGLAAGEAPTTRGYPPSVFSMLPQLVERTGITSSGTITAFYTVLVEGDDPNEPISDALRGLLDGHIHLSRQLASRGHFPAIDVLPSLSRLQHQLIDEEHRTCAQLLRKLLAVYAQHEELIDIGAYKPGSQQEIDTAIRMRPELEDFLKQTRDRNLPWTETMQQMQALARRANPPLEQDAESSMVDCRDE
jgi:flagellum-specific ATP synthase